MRFNTLTIALAASLTLSAAACGGDDDDTLTAGSFVTALSGGICDKAYECKASFAGTPAQFDASFGANEAACPAALMFVTSAQIQAAVDAGRVTFNASAGAMCISALNAFTCPAFWDPNTPFPATCNTALVGTVATGGACTINAECVSASCDGTMCNAPAVTGGSNPGPAAQVPQVLQ